MDFVYRTYGELGFEYSQELDGCCSKKLCNTLPNKVCVKNDKCSDFNKTKNNYYQTKDINTKDGDIERHLCLNKRKTKVRKPSKLPKICASQNKLPIAQNSSYLHFTDNKGTFESSKSTFISKPSYLPKYCVGSKLPEVKQTNLKTTGPKKTHWTEGFNQLKEKRKNNREEQKAFLESQLVGTLGKMNTKVCQSQSQCSTCHLSSYIKKKKLSPIFCEPRCVNDCSTWCSSNSRLSVIEEFDGQMLTVRRSYLDALTLSTLKSSNQQFCGFSVPSSKAKHHFPNCYHEPDAGWTEKNLPYQRAPKLQRYCLFAFLFFFTGDVHSHLKKCQ